MSKARRVRVESFGATIYDPESLGYFFVDHRQLAQLGSVHDLALGNWDCPSTMGEYPGTDSSNGQFGALLSSGTPVSVHPSAGTPPSHTLAAPIRIYFELTTRCNLRCEYCLNDSGLPRANALTSEEILNTIRNLGRDGVFEVRLTGGEVTVLPNFEHIANAVRRNGMTLSINSNLATSAKRLEALERLQPNLLITSLDAHEEAHVKARGRGYDTVVTNVRRLREAGVPVRLNCALSGNTLNHVGSFIDQFAPDGCGFCFILLRPVGRASEDFAPPELSDLMKCVDVIDAKRNQYPQSYFSTSFHVVMEKEVVIGGINLTGCNAIQKSFNINSDGSVLPCAFLYELDSQSQTLGNIRNTGYSVLPIWRESRQLQDLREESAACNQRCINCDHFKEDCLGSCVFMHMYAKHTGQPDPYCRLSLAKNNVHRQVT